MVHTDVAFDIREQGVASFWHLLEADLSMLFF